MSRSMLDTNIVSCLIKGHPKVLARITSGYMTDLCVSAITEGELLFGLAKRPKAKRLHHAVRELLQCVDVLAWESVAAQSYGNLRAAMERRGQVMAPLDMLIASHAISINAVLITTDRSFSMVSGLHVEDWTK